MAEAENTQNKDRNSGRFIVIILIAMILVLFAAGAFLAYQFFHRGQLIDGLEAQTKSLKEQVNSKSSEVELLKLQLDSLQSNGAIPQAEADSLRSRIAELESDLEREKRNHVGVPNHGGSSRRIDELKLELGAWSEKYDLLKLENGKLQEQNRNLSNQNSALQQQFQQMDMVAKDLQTKVELAAGLKVMDATMSGYRLKKNGDKIYEERTKKMAGLEVQFTVIENQLAKQGDRTAYIVITGPNRRVLFGNSSNTFKYLEIDKVYSKKSDFYFTNQQIEIKADISVSEKLVPGEYRAEVYIDGALAGYCLAEFK